MGILEDSETGQRRGRRRLPRRRAALVALLAAISLLSATMASSAAASPNPFGPHSFWNERLPRDAALSPHSASIVRKLVSQTRRFDRWINTTEYSAPLYKVGRHTRRIRVHVDTPSSMFTNDRDAARLQRRLARVPIPPGATPADGTDSHMIIWQPSTDTMWELWLAHHTASDGCEWGHDAKGGWHAAWGAKIRNASRHRGRLRAPFGARASGLPMAGGLMRVDELRRGRIDHALAIAIPEVASGGFVWPATRSDGDSLSPDAIPEGTRFRLDPTTRIRKLGLDPAARAMARAAKRYGVVVTDRAGAVVFYGEDPEPLSGINPYPNLFGGHWPSELLRRFPWERLQVLAPPR